MFTCSRKRAREGREREGSQGGAGNLIMANVRLSGAHLVCQPAGHEERERERKRGEFAHKGVAKGGGGFAVGSADLRAM